MKLYWRKFAEREATLMCRRNNHTFGLMSVWVSGSCDMSDVLQEIIEIIEALPEDKILHLADLYRRTNQYERSISVLLSRPQLNAEYIIHYYTQTRKTIEKKGYLYARVYDYHDYPFVEIMVKTEDAHMKLMTFSRLKHGSQFYDMAAKFIDTHKNASKRDIEELLFITRGVLTNHLLKCIMEECQIPEDKIDNVIYHLTKRGRNTFNVPK